MGNGAFPLFSDASVSYSGGVPAVRMKGGVGVVYYPHDSGEKPVVALVVAESWRAHQRTFQVFDDPRREAIPAWVVGKQGIRVRAARVEEGASSPREGAAAMSEEDLAEKARLKRRGPSVVVGPMLGAFSGDGTGFAVSGLEESASQGQQKLILTRKGGRLTGVAGEVVNASGESLDREWRWPAPGEVVRKGRRGGKKLARTADKEGRGGGILSGHSAVRPAVGEPPKPVSIRLNDHFTLTYSSRAHIHLSFRAPGIPTQEFNVGRAEKEVKGGGKEERGGGGGKKGKRLGGRLGGGGGRRRGLRGAGSSSLMQRSGLRAVVEALERDPLLEELRERQRSGKSASVPYNRPGWKERSLACTYQEAPYLHGRPAGGAVARGGFGPDPHRAAALAMERTRTVRGRSAQLEAEEEAIEEARKEAAEAAKEDAKALAKELGIHLDALQGPGRRRRSGGGGVDDGRRFVRSDAMGASLRKMGYTRGGRGRGGGGGEEEEEEKGVERDAVRGASFVKGRWISDVDTRRILRREHGPLPRSRVIRGASGHYGGPPLEGGKVEGMCGLAEAPASEALEEWVRSSSVCKGRVVVVACVRGDDSACRRTTQLLERVNGTLARLYPAVDPRTGAPTPSHTCPVVLARAEAAHGPWLAAKYGVRTVPTFLCFAPTGRLTYRGSLGGTTVQRLASLDRKPDVLACEPEPSHWELLERISKAANVDLTLARGIIRAPRPGADVVATGVTDAAIKAIKRRATARASRTGAAREGSARPAGTDATAQITADFAICLINASHFATIPTLSSPSAASSSSSSYPSSSSSSSSSSSGESLRGLVGALRSSAPAARVPGASVTPWGGLAGQLCGRSLVVAVLPTGTVAAGDGPQPLPLPAAAVEAGATILSRVAASDGVKAKFPSKRDPTGGLPFACPRTGILHNPTTEHTLGGVASVCVQWPVKPATLRALVAMWRALLQAAGKRSIAAAGADDTPKGPLGAKGRLPGALGDGDGAHFGLTHNDMLDRLDQLIQQANAGKKADTQEKVLLGLHEASIRGKPLLHAKK